MYICVVVRAIHRIFALLMMSAMLVMSVPKHWLHDCGSNHLVSEIKPGKVKVPGYTDSCSICDLDHHVYTPGVELAWVPPLYESHLFLYPENYVPELPAYTSITEVRGSPTL